MSNYLRPQQHGATVFFTVNLADRSSDLLVREIETLREAVAQTRAERPFKINAWVVLPDHMHCVWRLPDDDMNYSQRWGRIKSRFTRDLRRRLHDGRPGLGPGRPQQGAPIPKRNFNVRARRPEGSRSAKNTRDASQGCTAQPPRGALTHPKGEGDGMEAYGPHPERP